MLCSVSLLRAAWTTSASSSFASPAPPRCHKRHCSRRQSWSNTSTWKWKVSCNMESYLFKSFTRINTDLLYRVIPYSKIVLWLCAFTEIIQVMRSRDEDPDLLYVIKFLTAEEIPGLPPGGGITSKWVWIIHRYVYRGVGFGREFKTDFFFFSHMLSLSLSMQAGLYHLCLSETCSSC